GSPWYSGPNCGHPADVESGSCLAAEQPAGERIGIHDDEVTAQSAWSSAEGAGAVESILFEQNATRSFDGVAFLLYANCGLKWVYPRKDHGRRVRDSNPQALAGASFQDWCNSHSANPPAYVLSYQLS